MRNPWILLGFSVLTACSVGTSVVGGRDAAADLAPSDIPDVATFDAVDVVDAVDAVDAVDVVDVVDAPDVPFRCATSAECTRDPAAPVCDVSTGQCIACSAAEDRCPRGRYCVTATSRCADGCRTDDDCAGASADAGASVDAGTAGARCDVTTHACVACVTDAHCPPGNLCAGNVCAPGCSAGHACPGADACCGGACVDTNSNVASCGACDARCAPAHATPACRNGQCAVGACTAPFDDCDRAAANGCEADTSSDVAHCGGCGMACAARAHAAATCASGRCQYACDAGFADCDGDAANGCEVDTRTSAMHCGRCASTCVLANATAACAAGQCAVAACAAGFADCDGSALNGCEVDTRTSVTSCGACGAACPARANAFPGCVAGACVVACQSGFQDCDANPETGCEVDTRTSVTNCSACGRACAFASASARCTASVCELVACNAGFGDCDGNTANGCETNTTSALAHCGRCGNACPTGPHATPSCASSACAIACDAGFADCDAAASTGCEADLASTASCGRCGNACAAGQVCRSGACVTPRTASFVYAPGAGTVHVYSAVPNTVRLTLDVGAATPTTLTTLTFTGEGVRATAIPRDGVLRAESDAPFLAWVHDGLSGDKVVAAGDAADALRGTDLFTWAGSHLTVLTGATAPTNVRVQRLSDAGGAAVDVGTWTPGPNQQRAFTAGVSTVYRITATGAPVSAFGQLLTETYNHFAYVPDDGGTLRGTTFRYAEPAGAPGVRRFVVQTLTGAADVTYTLGGAGFTRRIDAALGFVTADFAADTLAVVTTTGPAIAWIEADPNNGCDGTLLDAELVPSLRGSTFDTEWTFRVNTAVSTCFVSRRADLDVLAYTDGTVVELYDPGSATPASRATIQRGQRQRVLTDADPNRAVRIVTSQPARVEMSHEAGQFVLRAPSITTFP